MRTTLDIDTFVLEQVKSRAKRERKAVGQVVSELLARSLADTPSEQADFYWPTHAMHARVDLENKEAVEALLAEEYDLRP